MFKEPPATDSIEANCHAKLSPSKQLLNDVIFIRFSDKKLFTLARPKNSQNGRLYASAATKNKDIEAVLSSYNDGDSVSKLVTHYSILLTAGLRH